MHAVKGSFSGFSFMGTSQGLEMVEPQLEYLQGPQPSQDGLQEREAGWRVSASLGTQGHGWSFQRGAGTGRTRGAASFPAISTQTEDRHPGCGKKYPVRPPQGPEGLILKQTPEPRSWLAPMPLGIH